jgi:FkbM family methyltransferase
MGKCNLVSLCLLAYTLQTYCLEDKHHSHFPPIALPPNTTDVRINIGSSIFPMYAIGPGSVSICFEPITHATAQWKAEARNKLKKGFTVIVPAAVSDSAGFTSMYVYNSAAMSSSLNEVQDDHKAMLTMGIKQPELLIVPVLTMKMVLAMIPKEYDIAYLKTDMQGHDCKTVTSAGFALKRVKHLYTEVNVMNHTSYKNIQNDFCHDWVPKMKELGFRPILIEGTKHHSVQGKFSKESDVEEYCVQDAIRAKSYEPSQGLSESNAQWKQLPW